MGWWLLESRRDHGLAVATATKGSWSEQKDFRRRILSGMHPEAPSAIMQQGLTCSSNAQSKDP